MKTLESDPGQEYWLNVPGDYDPQKKYTLIFSVHGMGGSGEHFSRAWNPNGFTLDGGRNLSASELIVLAPSFKGADWFHAEKGNGKKADEMLEWVFKAYSIDRDHVYLNGFSAGGAFAWTYLWLHKERKEPRNDFTGGVFLTGANCWRRIRPDDRYRLTLPWFIEVGDGEWNLASLGEDGVAAEKNLKSAGYTSVVFHKIENQGHSIGKDAKKLIFEWLYDQMHSRERERIAVLKQNLAGAKQAFEAGRFAEAARLLADAAVLPAKDPVVAEALALRTKIEDGCTAALAEAGKAQAAKLYAQAMAAYDKIAQEYAGLPGGDTAKARAAELRGDAGIAQQMAEQDRAVQAQARLKTARDLEAGKEYLKALQAYDGLAKAYADREEGKQAAVAAAKIRADANLMKTLNANANRAEADRKLRTARNFLTNGMKDQAVAILKDLIENFPETSAAKEAADLLN